MQRMGFVGGCCCFHEGRYKWIPYLWTETFKRSKGSQFRFRRRALLSLSYFVAITEFKLSLFSLEDEQLLKVGAVLINVRERWSAACRHRMNFTVLRVIRLHAQFSSLFARRHIKFSMRPGQKVVQVKPRNFNLDIYLMSFTKNLIWVNQVLILSMKFGSWNTR